MHSTDLSSYSGAQRLAQMVEAHWKAKGLTIRCEIVADTIRDPNEDGNGKSRPTATRSNVCPSM